MSSVIVIGFFAPAESKNETVQESYVPSIMLLTSSDILATPKGTVNLSPSLLVCGYL